MKSETLTLKVTPEEKELVKKLAEEQDFTVSKYLHRLIFKTLIQEAK